jgi:TonB family protein
MPSTFNVIVYSVQFGVLVIAALLITRALRFRAPLPSLRFWQAIFAASLALPLVQPRVDDADVVISSAALASIASAVSIDAVPFGDNAIGFWLLPIAVTGIAIRLLWLGIGAARLRGIIRGATVDRSLDPLLRELTSALETHATLAISDAIESPATVGLRRPLILLPRRVLDMPPAVQRAAIAHELVHVRRRDWLHTVAEEIWCALLWFHPAARLVASRLSLARETLVDQTTILLTRDRRAYAEALLAFANSPRGAEPHLPGVTPLIGRRHLSQRISLIAEEEVMSRSRIVTSVVIALAICAAATVSAAVTFPMTQGTRTTQVHKPGKGITLPVVVREQKPSYTPQAMQKKIQGTVWMAVVVLDSGEVGDVRITKSLDAEYGLDQEAMKAAKQWKFKPAMKDGKPVAIEVTVEMTFTLKDKK